MTNLSKEHVELVKQILQEICAEDTVPRSEVFTIFEERAGSGIERYRFERDVSELIKQGDIPGYQVKVGRKGGISKADVMEQVTVVCSSGKYVGLVPKNQLSEFITLIGKNLVEFVENTDQRTI